MDIKSTELDISELKIEVVDFAAAHDLLHTIRHQVFVLEQGVPEALEHDALDPQCLHLLAYWQETPVGTARLTAQGRIGRMAVLPDYRRHGIGSGLLQRILESAREQGLKEVVLAAQISAITFYERFGFRAEGVIFEEAGIDHLMMRCTL